MDFLLRSTAAIVIPRRSIISISGRTQFLVRHPSQPSTASGNRIVAPLKKSPTHIKDAIPLNGKFAPKKNSPNQGPSNVISTGMSPTTSTTTSTDAQDASATGRRGRQNKSTSLTEEDNQINDKGLIVRILKTRLIKNMTKNGKYQRFSILVAVGDGQGSVGIALCKATSAVDAIAKATRQATRNMEWFPLWQNRTLHHDDQLKYKASLLFARPAAPHTGCKAHPTILEICRCMGLTDMSAKVLGSRNPINVSEAFLQILRRQKTPEQVAQEGGMKIVDVLKIYQQGCEELNQTLRAHRYSTLELKLALKDRHVGIAP